MRPCVFLHFWPEVGALITIFMLVSCFRRSFLRRAAQPVSLWTRYLRCFLVSGPLQGLGGWVAMKAWQDRSGNVGDFSQTRMLMLQS